MILYLLSHSQTRSFDGSISECSQLAVYRNPPADTDDYFLGLVHHFRAAVATLGEKSECRVQSKIIQPDAKSKKI
jgi:hypothetical protein